ncbi:MAG: D-alanyl-D-alanine carboxypeptidase family protein, partial [Lachnospiraceae bacterium]|nr:D-alanyl-D-alanine carboxypeptidase family protein [Lachnospiraceae bacterium]
PVMVSERYSIHTVLDRKTAWVYFAVAMLLSLILLFSFSCRAYAKSPYPDGMDVFDATVWIMDDTPFVFKDESLKPGTLTAGTTVKIVAERGDDFYVRAGNYTGFVPKDVCMINLPDVMQDEMEYDITNSYSSIFKIHGEDIEGVTGEVFYPDVKLENGEFLVPLLFPVAEKLYEAEAYALSQGSTIKVYDAYRPHDVTKELYEKTLEFIGKNPEYKSYVTEGGYNLGAFLANTASNHNYGVAVDITLVDMETGEELEMQTDMHELSPLAVTSKNTYSADMLKTWMETHGFTGIVSEWWHFEIKGMKKKYATFQVKPYEDR